MVSQLVNCLLLHNYFSGHIVWPATLTFAHLSIALITLFALAPVAAWRVLANGILAAQMLIRGALVDVCWGRDSAN